jgi:hypothetical protein
MRGEAGNIVFRGLRQVCAAVVLVVAWRGVVLMCEEGGGAGGRGWCGCVRGCILRGSGGGCDG